MVADAFVPHDGVTVGPLSQRAAQSASMTATPALPQVVPLTARLASGKVILFVDARVPVKVFRVMRSGNDSPTDRPDTYDQ